MNLPEPHENWLRTLAEWRVEPVADPNFRPAVWARIRRHAQETWAAYLRAHVAGWALAVGIAAVAAGWTGHSVARARLDSGREQMVVSYLSELDPRVLAALSRE